VTQDGVISESSVGEAKIDVHATIWLFSEHGAAMCSAVGGVVAKVDLPADLAIEDVAPLTAALPESVAPGDRFTYRVQVRNSGPAVANGVTVSVQLPANVANPAPIVNVNNSGISAPCTTTGSQVTCSVDHLSVADEVVVEIPVTAVSPGAATATVSVRSKSRDPVTSNNQADISATVACAPPQTWNTATAQCDACQAATEMCGGHCVSKCTGSFLNPATCQCGPAGIVTGTCLGMTLEHGIWWNPEYITGASIELAYSATALIGSVTRVTASAQYPCEYTPNLNELTLTESPTFVPIVEACNQRPGGLRIEATIDLGGGNLTGASTFVTCP
jgi:uncharacterized repeat protein (TIGR01451 family)